MQFLPIWIRRKSICQNAQLLIYKRKQQPHICRLRQLHQKVQFGIQSQSSGSTLRAIADQDPGKGIVYLYTAKNAFTVALLHSNNDLNHEAVNDLEKELTNKSIPTFDLSISVTNPLYRYKSSARSVCPLTMRSTSLTPFAGQPKAALLSAR